MSAQAAGIPPGEGQPQPGNPTPAGQPQGQAQPGQSAPNQPPQTGEPPKQPQSQPQDIAALQQQLQAAQEEARRAAESARHFQSNFHQAQQKLQAVMGVQPEPDPLAEDVKYWVGQGYDEKEARIMVDYVARKTQPLMQQLQAAQQTLQATTQTGQVLQAAANDPEYAALFDDPKIANAVQQEMQRCALNGQASLVTPEYAKAVAESAWAATYKPWKQGGTSQQQPMQQTHNFPPFMGPQPTGFRPAPAAPVKQANPIADQLASQMSAYTGIPIQQQQQ